MTQHIAPAFPLPLVKLQFLTSEQSPSAILGSRRGMLLPSSLHICGFSDLTNKCFLGYSECLFHKGRDHIRIAYNTCSPSVACCLERSRFAEKDGTGSQVWVGGYQVEE